VAIAHEPSGNADRFEARLVLGAAHSGANRPDAAEATLRDALAGARSDGQKARAAGRIAVHLVAHGGRIQEAADLLDRTARTLRAADAIAFLDADRAKLASIRGDLTKVAAPADDADDLAVLNGSIVGAYAQAMAGHAAGCRATVDRALPLARAHQAVLPWATELVRFSLPFAALADEGPIAAHRAAESGLLHARRQVEPTIGTWRFLVGFTAAIAGDLRTASAHLADASEELVGHDLIGARPLAIASHAWVHAQIGEVSVARELLDDAIEAAAVDGRVRLQVAITDAWCDVRESGTVTPSIGKRVVDVAVEAARGGQLLAALIALNELARLGDPHRARRAVTNVTRDAPSGWFVEFVRDRVEGQDARNVRQMERVARRARGRWPLAEVELHGALHDAAAGAGDTGRAARAAFAAHRSADRSALVLPITLATLRHPLSAREREVAELVSRGESNRHIAAAAGVSVRTVDNQVQSIYRKLGLDGRDALRALCED
jgi:DNA-binding CsgD family transcriptional regulator